jgi:Phosphotransferase enzyme family
VARLLEPVLHQAGYHDTAIARCRPRVVRYKPGARCTVLADLDYADPGGAGPPPNPVVLKTHDDDKGAAAWAAMAALWRQRGRWRQDVRLAEPLAYLRRERILVQGPVPGEGTLKDLLRGPGVTDRLRDDLAATARGLAAVHSSTASYTRTATFAGELADTGRLVALLSATVPQVDAAVAPLLRHLGDLDHAQRPDPAVPAHGDFRPGQVLLHGGHGGHGGARGVGVIDFDKARMAEPAFDVALFRATLRDGMIGARYPGGRVPPSGGLDADLARLDVLCDHFLAAYRERAQVSPERVRLWETLHLLTALLHAWSKVRPAHLRPRLALLTHHLRDAEADSDAGSGLALPARPCVRM